MLSAIVTVTPLPQITPIATRGFPFGQLAQKEEDMLGSLTGWLCMWVQVGWTHYEPYDSKWCKGWPMLYAVLYHLDPLSEVISSSHSCQCVGCWKSVADMFSRNCPRLKGPGLSKATCLPQGSPNQSPDDAGVQRFSFCIACKYLPQSLFSRQLDLR